MQNRDKQHSKVFRLAYILLGVVLLIALVLSVAQTQKEFTIFQTSSTKYLSLESGDPCPVTPAKFAPFFKSGPVAGVFPIWIANGGRMSWDSLGANVLTPYSGRISKTIWIINTDIKGDLRIEGRQVDGDGILLFPKSHDMHRTSETSVEFVGKVSNFILIQNAHQKGDGMHSPENYQYHAVLVYYPNSGCYQFKVDLADKVVEMVIEIE
ncbi:MAG: hypothetical protein KC445_18530 [Anaerolineales bacterium]|nr:hypothetical protein [Anaerolineales bacterium]MCB8929388.1 hypothetical protein [Ardenticatenaceae bacterium]MCB8948068.1 hypothetical protein [Ardenticatenaceae bacterium]